MASRRFPDPAARWVIRKNGDRAKNDPITYYLDAAGQTPAAVYAERGTDTPAPTDQFVGSTTTLDAFGGQVDFRGPTDGTSMLFAQVGDDGPIFEVPCKPEDQIAELEDRVAELEPGGAGEAADRTLSNLTDATAARNALGLGNAATRSVGTSSGAVAAGDAPATAQAAAIAAAATDATTKANAAQAAAIAEAVPTAADLLASSPVRATNPVAHRQLVTLQRGLEWAAKNGTKLAMTEIGFPGRTFNTSFEGQTIHNWGPIAELMFSVLDSTDVPVSQWADASGMFTALDNPQTTNPTPTQALAPILRHRYGAPRFLQAGGAVGIAPPAGYSNSNPNTGSNWFPPAEWFKVVADLGFYGVRMSARWETLQPTLNGALSSAEVTRITTALDRANTYGLKVILDPLHNYAGYITSGGTLKIGGGTLTAAHLADVWTKLIAAFGSHPAIYAMEMMNEPTGLSSAATWESASQTALTAIRTAGYTGMVIVPAYDFSALSRLAANHSGLWFTDTANNSRVGVHFYMSSADGAHGGDAEYGITWAEELTAQNFPGGYGYGPLAPEIPSFAPTWMSPPQGGEMTTPRSGLSATPAAQISGEIKLTYFQAQRTEDITQIRYRVLTAQGTAPTLTRIGIYAVNADGTLTLMTALASDTTLFGTFGDQTKTLPAPFRKRAGLRYAVGTLTIQASGTMPALAGMGSPVFWDKWPPTSMTVFGQTDLPNSIATGSLSVNNPAYQAFQFLP